MLNPKDPGVLASFNDTHPQVEVAMPGVGGEVKVALLALSILEERLSRGLGPAYEADAGQPFDQYVQAVAAAVMAVVGRLPSPNWDVPILLGLLRLAVNALLDFQLAIKITDSTEPEKPKNSIPLDESLKAV